MLNVLEYKNVNWEVWVKLGQGHLAGQVTRLAVLLSVKEYKCVLTTQKNAAEYKSLMDWYLINQAQKMAGWLRDCDIKW